MHQDRSARRLLAIALVITLTLGCDLIPSPIGTADPFREAANTAAQKLRSGDAQATDQAERGMTDLLREQSGARAALGDQADATFLEIDQAKAAALTQLVREAQATSGYAPTPGRETAMTALLKMAGTLALLETDYQPKSWNTMLTTLGTAPYLFADARRDENGNAIFPPMEQSETEGNTTISFSMKAKLTGSKMEVELVLTASTTQPVAYSETATGKINVDVCPDVQGNVPLQFSYQSGTSLGAGGGGQVRFESHVTGHVNDEGRLAGWDLETTGSGAHQPLHAGAGESESNKYVEIGLGVKQSDTDAGGPKVAVSITRASSETDTKSSNEMGIALVKMNLQLTTLTLSMAEMQWTRGYCLEVQVPDLGTTRKSVQPGSITRFTAQVRHKFDNAELPLPVIATLSSGGVSINPAASKVLAPAKFTYAAPGGSGQSATANLETRSKRGIAKLDIAFTTGGWKVDGVFGATHIVGEICSLVAPFTLNWDSGVGLAGTITFSPSDEGSGTWNLEGRYDPGVTNAGNGNYTIETDGEENPTAIALSGTSSQTTFGYGTTSFAFSETIQLYPSACSQP